LLPTNRVIQLWATAYSKLYVYHMCVCVCVYRRLTKVCES